MPSKTVPSGYVLEPLREGADFTLYRGRQHGNPSPIRAVAITAEQPSPHGLKRLEHEYALRDTLIQGVQGCQLGRISQPKLDALYEYNAATRAQRLGIPSVELSMKYL